MVDVDGVIGGLVKLVEDADAACRLGGGGKDGGTELVLFTACEQLKVNRMPPGRIFWKAFAFKRR